MAAPTPTTRVTPDGWKMPDGFKTLVTFSLKSQLDVWEVEVTPAGMDSGDKIDTSTMHNTRWRTFQPRQLVTLTDGSADCAWDPDAYSDILSLLGAPLTITERYPDSSTTCYYGFMQKWQPASMREGEMPRATMTFVPTNWDHVNKVEAAPVHTASAGT